MFTSLEEECTLKEELDIMTDNRKHRFALLAAVATLLLFTVFTGCDEKPQTPVTRESQPVPHRMENPAYRETLAKARDEQKAIARRRNAAVEGLEALIQRAREALPAGATDEQIKAELESHPTKYPGWRELMSRVEAANAAAGKNLDVLRREVRMQILKESAAQRAVVPKK